jgi:hypothetical protein
MILLDNGRPTLAATSGKAPSFPEILEWGYHLANTDVGVPEGSYKNLWEAKGWKQYVAHMPAHKQPTAAIMLENCRAKFGSLEEVTRTADLGTFDKWIFPVIANMAENEVIDQMVALQPMAGPVSQIVYMDIVTEFAKGPVPAGTPMWRAIQGAVDRFTDADEEVTNEDAGTLATSTLPSYTAQWLPLRPGTVTLAYSSSGGSAGLTNAVIQTTDDGNGNIQLGGYINGGTINYITGVLSGVTSTQTTGEIWLSYAWNSEGQANIQGYELRLSSVPVTAKVLKLRTIWSEEADQNLQAMYNIKLEATMIQALTNGLQYQKHRQVISDIRSRATAGAVSWDATPPTSVNYQTHKFSFIDALTTAGMMILGATNMVSGNWLLVGLQASTVIQTLPQFTAKGNITNTQGIAYIGDLAGFKVFRDPHYPVNEWLVGYKGDQFVNTGYVLAEYQKLYTTPDIMLTDFLHRRGFATSFAKHMVNAGMFARGQVLNAPITYGPQFG